MILPCIIFVPCVPKVFGITVCGFGWLPSFWIFVTFWKLSIVRPKTPRNLKEFFWATFNHFRQKAKKILSFLEHTDINFGNQ